MSSPSPLVAENYHLKWDSHLANLNLSLTSLFRTERFADVMLLSSHPDCVGGPAIPAHKIILSSCSHFFSTIFTNQLAQNGLMYIMLPPELSYRCIKTLVQYMYSGESTVSNDILNEVLRGGEILKIRGLYKSRSRQTSQRSCTPSGTNLIGKSPVHQSPIPSFPKESPVIIKLPNKSVQKITPCPVPLPILEKGLISIKKDIAIDPEGATGSSDLLQTACKNCSQNCCKKCLPPPSKCNIKEENITPEQKDTSGPSVISGTSNVNLTEKLINCEPSTSGMSTSKRKINDSSANNKTTHSVSTKADEITSKNELEKLDNLLINQENSIKMEKDIIEIIKEEPMDWHQSNSENSTSSSQLAVKPPPPLLENIKTESADNNDTVSVSDGDQINDEFEIFEVDDDNDSDNCAPLECEICNEKFALPRDWVRHIESHMEGTAADVPKKRQRVMRKKETDEDDEYIVALKCDLCSTFFNTPAAWVRHIENEHTESELAEVNCKHENKPVTMTQHEKNFDSYLNKACDICGESFPTYAKMIIHYRTHSTKKN